MAATNYFKVSAASCKVSNVFLFDDRDAESINAAWDSAQDNLDYLRRTYHLPRETGRIVAWKRPTKPGPWHSSHVISEPPQHEQSQTVGVA